MPPSYRERYNMMQPLADNNLLGLVNDDPSPMVALGKHFQFYLVIIMYVDNER